VRGVFHETAESPNSPKSQMNPRQAMNEKFKVLYIMGWGRSGSTLLANILGQIRGLFSVGEISAIWEWGFLRNWSCGCGKPFRSCGFWNRVVCVFDGETGTADAERWEAIRHKETRTLNAPKFLLSSDGFSASAALRTYLSATEKIYSAVREISGNGVIVDSSKSPFYGGLLGRIPRIELYLVHLIRDPRAVAYSWSVQKPQPDSPMKKIGAAQSSASWMVWNASAERLGRRHPGRYLRVRYEDFIRRPAATVGDILRLAGEEAAELPFTAEHSVFLNTTHTVRGNPDRFLTGKVDLIPDIRWQKGIQPGARRICAMMTWPLMLRYGYRP
jgi:hypothetical protein